MLLQQEIELLTVICRFNYYIAGDGSDANMFHTIYSQNVFTILYKIPVMYSVEKYTSICLIKKL